MSNRVANLAYLAAHVGCVRLGNAGTLAGLSDAELERMVSLIRETEAERTDNPRPDEGDTTGPSDPAQGSEKA